MGSLIKHDELPLAGLDGEFGRKPQTRIDDIAEQTGGIDDARGKDSARRRLYPPRIVEHTGQNLRVSHQLRAQRHRLREIAKRGGPRINDMFARNVERGDKALG